MDKIYHDILRRRLAHDQNDGYNHIRNEQVYMYWQSIYLSGSDAIALDRATSDTQFQEQRQFMIGIPT